MPTLIRRIAYLSDNVAACAQTKAVRGTGSKVSEIPSTGAGRWCHMQLFTWLTIALLSNPVFAADPPVSANSAAVSPSPLSEARKLLKLDAAQRATLKLQTVAIEAAAAGGLLASATVIVTPGKETAVQAPLPGNVIRLLAGIGDTVTAGTPILVYASTTLSELRRQVREAQLDLDAANNVMQREELLFSEGLIPQARLDLTRNRQSLAQATLNARQSDLRAVGQATGSQTHNNDSATATLVAPMSGTLIELSTGAGQRLEPGTAIARIADTGSLQLDIRLSPDKAAVIRPGDPVTVPGAGASGVVIGVARAIDAQQQSRARARITQIGTLQAGASVMAEIAARKAGALKQWRIPSAALFRHQGKDTVFMDATDGVQAVQVRIISSTTQHTTVAADLSSGQQVITAGVSALHALLQRETP